MILEKLSLANFRGFEQIDLSFDRRVTVIAGVNGVGKSGILHALTVLFSRSLPEFTVSTTKAISFTDDDIHHDKVSLETSAVFTVVDQRCHISVHRVHEGEGQGDRPLLLLENVRTEFSRTGDLDAARTETQRVLRELRQRAAQPLVVYFSPRRQLPGKPKTIPKPEPFAQKQAYPFALEDRDVTLREFMHWFRAQEMLAESKDDIRQQVLNRLREVVTTFLPEFTDLRLETSPVRMLVNKDGVPLMLNQLSDGERGMLAILFDLTRRLAIANLHYSTRNENSLDVALSVNGIPVVTMELKNHLTGQTVDHAMRQYRNDRDPREIIFEFKRRTLVHFAADPDLVFMTTRLAGSATHFLPFNRGNEGGAGNPPDERGRHRTAYLWEEVLARESLLDLFARFLHLQLEERRTDDGRKVRKESMIFPRYHQLQAVRSLVDAARGEGVGHNYLIEHSAGSGKSNTIGWLAHRLASLHNEQNERVFDSVIVITDRLVLDQQLQDTIYQFDHRQGVVQKIEANSRQLAEALESGVPIIISTLQKFPFVTRQLLKLAEERGETSSGVLPTRKCAVIVDEAHSSQSGETATDLKEVLGGEALREAAARYANEEGAEDFEGLYRSMAKRGRQANLSLFAFTATPKHKTLKVFGRNGEAFHKYAMRQAIDEGFIMDVLKTYTTYSSYYKLVKACQEDPEVERKKAAKALARFMRLHPHNIAQKTEIMVEHFNAVTRHKIGGKAKAMVVTGSRLEAVRYKQSFDRYISKKGYPIKTLAAFSGTVVDDKIKDKTYTEEKMNCGIREKDLPEHFATPEYHVLLVAEKYQTGFDQPLLHTMYIDRRLFGIQAVQTLSRLNRVHPLKEDTFVLDFFNDRQEIQAAFKQFYEGAEMGEEVDPARMYEIKAEMDASGIYLSVEVDKFCRVFFKPKSRQNVSDHRDMNAILDPAVERFRELMESDEDAAELWRGKLAAFRNLYSFLSQVIPYQDSDLEKLYTYLRHLASKLPRRRSGPQYSFDDEIRLEYYRLQKISEGSISLKDGKAEPLHGPREVGSGVVRDQSVPLSRLIDVVNERFGTDFTDADQLFFDQIIEAALGDDGLRQAAQANPEEKFALVFNRVLESLFVERMEQNEDIFARFMNDKDFQQLVASWLVSDVYKKFQSPEEKAS